MPITHFQDPTKTADEILTQLINQSNQDRIGFVPYPPGRLKFRNATRYLAEEGYDTTIQVSDLEDPQESDWYDLYYSRVSITSRINRIEPTMVFKPEYATVHDMLDDLNERFVMNITADDVEDLPIDSEASLPITVPLVCKEGAKIYRGSTAVYLVDPNSGTGIITPVQLRTDVALEADFSDDGKMIHDGSDASNGFIIADNGEISVACSLRRIGDTAPLVIDNGTVVIELADDQAWDMRFNFGLLNTVNGSDIGALYEISIQSPTAGPDNLNLKLIKMYGNYLLSNPTYTLQVSDSSMGPNKSYLQNSLSLQDLNDIVANKTKNSTGSPLGDFEFTLTAKRTSGNVPPVVLNVKMRTKVNAGIQQETLSPVNEINTSAPGNTTTLTHRVRVTGPTGIPATLKNAVEIDYAFSGVDAALESIHGALTIVGTKITVPAGTAKGLYPIVWNVTGIPETPGEGKFDALSAAGNNSYTWNVIANEQPPSILTNPAIVGDMVVGSVLTVTSATYESYAPATVTTEIEIDGVKYPLVDGEFTLTAEHIGFTVRAVESITNNAGTTVATSIAYGPVAGEAGDAPTVVERPSIGGDPMANYSIQLYPGTYSGAEPITLTGVIRVGSETIELNPIPEEIDLIEDWIGEMLTFEVTATNASGSITSISDEFGPIVEEVVTPDTLYVVSTPSKPHAFTTTAEGDIYLSMNTGGKMLGRYNVYGDTLIEDATFNTSGIFGSPCTFVGRRQNGDIIALSSDVLAVLDGTTGQVKAGTSTTSAGTGSQAMLFDETSVTYANSVASPAGLYTLVDGGTPTPFAEFDAKPLSLMLKDSLGGVLVASRSIDKISAMAPDNEQYYSLLRFNDDGSLDDGFRFGVLNSSDNSNIVMPPFMATSAAESGDGYIVGGYHDEVGPPITARDGYICRIDRTGAVDPTFNCDVNGPVQYIQDIGNGTYLIVGSFSAVNGTAKTSIAFIDATGALVNSEVLGVMAFPNISEIYTAYENDALVVSGNYGFNGTTAIDRLSALKVLF